MTAISMQIDIESSRLAEKERYFREFTIWPVFEDFDTDGWLSNFEHSEKSVAERLLTNFTYFNEKMTDALLIASVQNFFACVAQLEFDSIACVTSLISESAFVICEGEDPNPTDSGYMFGRKLRDRLKVPEHQILRPNDALKSINQYKRFVFIDDFAGSGNQFIETWRRRHYVHGGQICFAELARQSKHEFAYCCCVATAKARTTLLRDAPAVRLCPAHQLEERHSAVVPESNVWDGYDAAFAIRTIKAASTRAGYDTEDLGLRDWRGFHALGLTLAFSHGIPDASLPIFFSNRNGWKPLIVRN